MVTFDKDELKIFSLDELNKMLDIQIKSDKFEGAVLIRDIINERKKNFGIDSSDDGDDTDLI